MDCRTPGFSVHHYLSEFAQTVSLYLLPSLCVCVCVCVCTRSVAQLCPTLFDPIDCSPLGSSVHGDSPGKNTGMGCHVFLQGIFPTQGFWYYYFFFQRLKNWGEICITYSLVQFSLVAQSYQTLCNPMNRSTTGLPVHHQLPESTQSHIHQVGDAIQPSHPLSSPSPPPPNPSQHQGLFTWVNSSHQVTKVLEFQLQHQSFQWTPRTDLL